jgi:hypothetical protein
MISLNNKIQFHHPVNRSYNYDGIEKRLTLQKTFTSTQNPSAIPIVEISNGTFIDSYAILIRKGKKKGLYRTLSGNTIEYEDAIFMKNEYPVMRALHQTLRKRAKKRDSAVKEVSKLMKFSEERTDFLFGQLVYIHGLAEQNYTTGRYSVSRNI